MGRTFFIMKAETFQIMKGKTSFEVGEDPNDDFEFESLLEVLQ